MTARFYNRLFYFILFSTEIISYFIHDGWRTIKEYTDRLINTFKRGL
jgi:hypothetical protein